jgi:hypothetical protein
MYTNHASWKDIPSSMCPATKDKDAPISAYNEDQGMLIKIFFKCSYETEN